MRQTLRPERQIMSPWDKGYSFKRLLEYLLEVRNFYLSYFPGTKGVKGLAYTDTLIVQLLNALRISEAIDCIKAWSDNPHNKVYYVKVRKKKYDEYRECVVPYKEVFDERDLLAAREFRDKLTANRLKAWSKMVLGINTHTLRYARINDWLERGIDPVIVSKTIRHSKLDTLLAYARAIKLQELIREDLRAYRKLRRFEEKVEEELGGGG